MELINQPDVEIDERLTFDLGHFNKFDRLKDLRNVTVKGNGHYDCSLQRFKCILDLAGEMVVPCAVTLEDVVVDFDFDAELEYSFLSTDDEDVIECKKDFLDLTPHVFQLIFAEVPLKVVKEGITYPKGDGWEVLTEEEYRQQTKDTIDPRLAKLRDFKFDKEN